MRCIHAVGFIKMIRMCDIKNKIKVKPSEITFICLLTFTIAEEQIMKLLQKLDMH